MLALDSRTLLCDRFLRPCLRAVLARHHSPNASAPSSRQSRFKGVSWHQMNQKWVGRVNDPESGKQFLVGSSSSEEKVAFAVDCANLALRGSGFKINFDATIYSARDIDHARRRIEVKRSRRKKSIYRGVWKRGSTWWAQCTFGGDKILVKCDTEIEAARSYDEALRRMGVSRAHLLRYLNFKVDDDYFDECALRESGVDPFVGPIPFLGVSIRGDNGKFCARFSTKYLGSFDDPVDAAKAFDAYSLAQGGPTNFKRGAARTCQLELDAVQTETFPKDDGSGLGRKRVVVRSSPPQQQYAPGFTRKAMGSLAGVRREQPLVLTFRDTLVSKGHDVEVRCYFEVTPDGKHTMVGKCDLYDRTTRTLYEAKSNADPRSLCMAIGQLMRYKYFEQAEGIDYHVSLSLLLPADAVKALGELDRGFLEWLRQTGIGIASVPQH